MQELRGQINKLDNEKLQEKKSHEAASANIREENDKAMAEVIRALIESFFKRND